MDALLFLDPSAIRRLKYSYIHATDPWINALTARARSWLADSEIFEPLIRDTTDSLYLIQPSFLHLKVKPEPASYEALRMAVPSSTSVYLSPGVDPLDSLRVASSLSHANLLGRVPRTALFVLTDIPSTPVDRHTPDLVVASRHLAPSGFDPNARRPIWWNEKLAVYSPGGAVHPVMPARNSRLKCR